MTGVLIGTLSLHPDAGEPTCYFSSRFLPLSLFQKVLLRVLCSESPHCPLIGKTLLSGPFVRIFKPVQAFPIHIIPMAAAVRNKSNPPRKGPGLQDSNPPRSVLPVMVFVLVLTMPSRAGVPPPGAVPLIRLLIHSHKPHPPRAHVYHNNSPH